MIDSFVKFIVTYTEKTKAMVEERKLQQKKKHLRTMKWKCGVSLQRLLCNYKCLKLLLKNCYNSDISSLLFNLYWNQLAIRFPWKQIKKGNRRHFGLVMHQNIDNEYASIGNEYVTNIFELETSNKLEESQYIIGELPVRSTWFGNCPLIMPI
jgi:hypothetical protein